MVHPTVAAWSSKPWTDAPLVAVDLEGTGGQDRDDEAILEIAAIRLLDGVPDTDTAYTTLVNPGRPVPPRRWISPGLAGDALADAPALAVVEPHLAARLNDRILIGHNVGVDWRLLRRRCPAIAPAALLDTHKLARVLNVSSPRGLTTLLDEMHLIEAVNAAAPSSQPHRALWDTAGTALLLGALVRRSWPSTPMLATVIAACGQPVEDPSPTVSTSDETTLF
ncbi:3'-5' exonuclease [Dactylosporangium sp. NPDC049525]|uniref:3'-5' exonuclease n=1 Tax=Dactylosporangium sp. NPDC049525 TaxID=3154730 RepID=UPI0034281509